MHPDPFLRSMALWILKDPSASLNTLLQTNVGSMHPQYHDDDRAEGSTGIYVAFGSQLIVIHKFITLINNFFFHLANPNVFNFYVYLRTHPLLIRQYLATTYQDKKKHTVVIAGFSYGSEAKSSNGDRQVTFIPFS